MEFTLDNNIGKLLNDYDMTMDCYIYDDFDIGELELCHSVNFDSLVGNEDDGFSFIDI